MFMRTKMRENRLKRKKSPQLILKERTYQSKKMLFRKERLAIKMRKDKMIFR